MNASRSLIAAGALSFALVMPVAATAQTAVSGSQEEVVLPGNETPVNENPGGVGGGEEVLGENQGNPNGAEGGVGGGEEVLGNTVVRGLAITGTDVAGMAALGGAALVGGAAVLASRRRRLA